MTSDWRAKVEWGVHQIGKHSSTVHGCSEADLIEFQQQRGLELPAAYRCFLRLAGLNPGAFLQGSDLRFQQLDRLQSSSRDLVQESGGPTLPENAFVFCGHQGYQFLFFDLDESEDPPVRYYLEGEREFKDVALTFSEWLVRTVHEEFPDAPMGEATGN